MDARALPHAVVGVRTTGGKVGTGAYYNCWHGDMSLLPDVVVRPWRGSQLHVMVCPPHIQSGIDPSTKSLGLTTKFDWAKGKFAYFSSMYEVDSDLFQDWLTASHHHIDTGTMKLFFALQHHYDNPLHLFNDLQSYGMWVLSWHGRHWRKCWLVHILLLLLLLLLFCSFFIQEKSCSENLTG